MEKVFIKTLERDSTLVIQGIWAKALTRNIEAEFGIKSPHRPAVIHYATGENLQIWENKKAIEYLQNRILKKGENFLRLVLVEYKKFVVELNKFWNKLYLTEEKDFQKYLKLIEESVLYCTLFFYAGSDERAPDKIKEITVKGREAADFFARNDEFVRNSISHINPELTGLENLILPAELVDLPNKKELIKRANGIILIDGIDVLLETFEKFSTRHIGEYKFEFFAVKAEIKELKGQTACLGKAKGAIRIVKNRRQIKNVRNGDILVSPMTTPDFISAMKRASAFITDEGGVVCHAAIVAREMKKPCIVGTKIATGVLKDGDIVEVNADEGVIKILKRAQIS